MATVGEGAGDGRGDGSEAGDLAGPYGLAAKRVEGNDQPDRLGPGSRHARRCRVATRPQRTELVSGLRRAGIFLCGSVVAVCRAEVAEPDGEVDLGGGFERRPRGAHG